MQPIILYDMPSKSGAPWNPMPMRTRYCLGFKGLPYQTVWIEYPNISDKLKILGAAPGGTLPDGNSFYTLPAIEDPNRLDKDGKPTVVADSFAIATYLDEKYPNTKPLIPKGTEVLQAVFEEYFVKNILFPGGAIFLPLFFEVLTEESRPYFRATREPFLGRRLEETCKEGTKEREETWTALQKALSTLAKKINKKDRYIMGDTPSFADIVVVSLTNMVATFTPKDWEGRVSQWDDGKWAALHATCSGWKKID